MDSFTLFSNFSPMQIMTLSFVMIVMVASFSDISATICQISQPYLPSRRSLRLAKSPLLGTDLVPTWEHFSPNVGICCSLNGNN